MALTSCKDKSGIHTSLDIGPQKGLNFERIRISCDLLELIDGHHTRFIGMAEVFEYLIKSHIRILNITETETPYWHIVYVEGYLGTDRTQHAQKSFPYSLAFRLQSIHNRLTKHIHKIAKAIGRIDVNAERIVTVFNLRLLETMEYQICLTHPSG